VVAIVFEEKCEAPLDLLLVATREGSADEHGGSVADVGVHGFVGERRFVEMDAHGVHGIGQIAFGIDESAVQIKN
jgi:hypothetical protein